MVRDGVVVVLPLYLLVLVLDVMVVMVPPTFLCHCTLVIARLDDTVHTKVTVFPVFTSVSHDISDKSPIVTINIDFPLLVEWVVLNLAINLRHNPFALIYFFLSNIVLHLIFIIHSVVRVVNLPKLNIINACINTYSRLRVLNLLKIA
jgi:hypothetical protein